jgi:hypothetical protein
LDIAAAAIAQVNHSEWFRRQSNYFKNIKLLRNLRNCSAHKKLDLCLFLPKSAEVCKQSSQAKNDFKKLAPKKTQKIFQFGFICANI